ncbi:MAG: hypothetical protein HY709_07695, partial [Candidatus Latescibacteria bacterium]|nr:hypothetical protein [Candidatus Latescibacterota bacterium]
LVIDPPIQPSFLASLKLEVTGSMFEAVITDASGHWHIRNDSKVWKE